MLFFIILILFLILLFIIIDSNRFVVREYTIYSDNINDDKDFLFLSDLHCKSYGENNRKLLKKIYSLKFDGILISGDMLTTPTDYNSFLKTIEFMRMMASLAPVFYALGNHEQRAKYNEENYGNIFQYYESILSDIGIKLYDNESADFDGITIKALSLPKKCYKKVKKLPFSVSEINELIGEKNDRFTILLAHMPDYFDEYVKYGADLTLSGHNHGGIVRIPGFRGLLSPRFEIFPKYDGGIFAKEGKSMVVSRGLGAHTIPLRLFNPAEIILLHIKSVEK